MNNIQTLKTMSDLEPLLPKMHGQTLVIFDVADVLLRGKSTLFNSRYDKIRDALRQQLVQTYGKQSSDRLWSIVLLKEWGAFVKVVEQQTPALIKKIQQSGAKVMALSRMRTGPLGHIASLEDWRIATLAAHGIDFSTSCPHPGEVVLTELERDGVSSIYKKGVLCTHKQPKGAALDAFLKKIAWAPAEVIFVDDKIDYLASVHEVVAARGIPFTGFHYVASFANLPELDEQLTAVRFKHLVEHEEWLTDDEAPALMKK